MIKINKGTEPKEWTKLNVTEGVTKYEAIPELRSALLRDQGYICAYCMRVIPVQKKDPNQSEDSKIEHIKPRTKYPAEERLYSNMVVCCPGYINSSDHCDKSKKSEEIHFSPFDHNVQESISYSSKDGAMKSTNTQWQKDIDEVICLNNPMLKVNRLQTLDGVKSILFKKKYSIKVLEEKLKEWGRPDAEGKRKAYCGVVIWYLEKKIKGSK